MVQTEPDVQAYAPADAGVGRLTDAEFVLSVLEDGPATSAQILRRSFDARGCGLMVHSRIADLRKRGHRIECEHIPGATRGWAYEYRLLDDAAPLLAGADGGAASSSEPVSRGAAAVETNHDPSSPGSLEIHPEQMSLA